jgi:hypothetical protein
MQELWRFSWMRETTTRVQRDIWEERARTCCETKQFRGPTSAKIPICEVDRIRSHVSRALSYTYSGDVVDDPIDDLALEGLEDYGTIARDKLGLAVARDYHALANVRDGHDSDDEAKLAGAGPLNVGIELRLKVLLHARPEVGRMEHDRVRELFLQKRMGRFVRAVRVRARRRRELR